MSTTELPITGKQPHPWLRRISLGFIPGAMTPLLEAVTKSLLDEFQAQGHDVQDVPNDRTDLILTTAPFGEPISWRDAVLFGARRRFAIRHSPVVYTLVHASPKALERLLDHLAEALSREPPRPDDYSFPGLAKEAYLVLHEQGGRGGPILALQRLVQAQAKGVRILLVVGDDRPDYAHHFDLVGAYPRSNGDDLEAFYEDLVLRIVTTVSTEEATEHDLFREAISSSVWERLETPAAMATASEELGKRGFFTEPVVIAKLVKVPAVSDAVASQYSEGCFATWDPTLEGLVATVTGSARPIDKGKVTSNDLAVIAGVRPDQKGALVRPVEGVESNLPSSEAVEMVSMDRLLPQVELDSAWGVSGPVPVVRSKLHGHRGVDGYDPRRVEFVPLDLPYYDYLVSCASGAQAKGVSEAFARSEALRDRDDPRRAVFTVLPGHGIMIAEKWVGGTVPFQAIWEHIDAGYLEIASRVPQGRTGYVPAGSVRMALEEEPSEWG